MNDAPIGVFDSGLGGMSVLRELVRRLPHENFVYVADSGHCPYGGKSQQQIIARAVAITDFLLGRGAKLIDRHAGSVRIITQPCPGLPERVEAGELESAETRILVERYTAPLLAGGADVMVLGSTHYPFLRPLIQQVVGGEVKLLDTGEAVARRVEDVLAGNGEELRADRIGRGGVEWFSSGTPQHMQAIGSRLWGLPIVASAIPL